ncbi:MAG TPA: VWA domain-containing protein [Pyrinomonadaceae bacterium]|jgi:VWFA-related protein
MVGISGQEVGFSGIAVILERATGLYYIASKRRYVANSRHRLSHRLNRMHIIRTRVLNKFLPLLCLAIGLSISVSAQKPKPSPSPTPLARDDQTIITNIRRVRLPITVVDKKGQFVPGLTQRDFIVLEDKVPQQIETFSDDLSQTLPLYVAVLMDTSPSTAGKLKFQQESAMNFIQTVVRPRKDRVLFGTFDDQISLLQDFTDKLDLLDKAVYGVKKMGKQTALFDAVWQFCDEKMRSVPGRRVLLLVTDGEDTYSRANLRDAIDIAQRTETTIFAISTKAGFISTVPGVEAGQVSDKKDRDLQTLAEETGGLAFFTGDMLTLERSFTKISKELRAQYLVTYNPTNKNYDGAFRKIDVRLSDGHDGLKIRTKRGYKAITDSVMQQ